MRHPVLIAIGLGLGLVCCSRPRFEGPQIQNPPPGFGFDANATQGHNVFMNRRPARQMAWWKGVRDDEPHSDIFITEYTGRSSREEIAAAREAQAARYSSYTDYGELAPITVDEHSAWAWVETPRYRGAHSMEYKAVIPYDNATYAVEFYSNDPEWMDPGRMQAVVATFAIGRTRISWPLVVIFAVVGVGVAVFVRRTARPVSDPASGGPPAPGTSG